MTTSYEAFLPEVMPFAPSVPEIVAVNAIRNAAIEFCDKSEFWLQESSTMTAVAGVSDYDLDFPTGTEVARIYDAWLDEYRLAPRSEEELARIYKWDYRDMAGRPQYTTLVDPNYVRLVPTPIVTSTNGLKVIVVLRPTRASTSIDDDIYQRWLEVIAHGALARLHAIPGQPYTNVQAAAAHKTMFNAGVTEAKIERNRALGRSVVRVRPPFWA